MHVRAYLRASTHEQDADRARDQVQQFAKDRGLVIGTWYMENESGAKLRRPELFRLFSDCSPGDVLLVEQVDRLSRLNEQDWDALKREIETRGVLIVALDLPTSWSAMNPCTDEMTARVMKAMNGMLLDVLAAVARKDYTDRKRRQAQGIKRSIDAAAAKGQVLYKGRQENAAKNKFILEALRRNESWKSIEEGVKCSRSTISRMLQRLKAEAQSDNAPGQSSAKKGTLM